MNQESTGHLNNILKNTSIENCEEYIAQHADNNDFSTYFSDYMQENNIRTSQIVKKCEGLVGKSYIYEILGGKKKPSRDRALILCMAAEMNLKTTNRVLEALGYTPLYPKSARDAIIAIFINNGVYDVDGINDRLFELKEDTLPADKDA